MSLPTNFFIGRGGGGPTGPFTGAWGFTSAGLDGATGPTLTNVLSAYSSYANISQEDADVYNNYLNNTSYFNVSNGTQRLTFDADTAGQILITARAPSGTVGASGGTAGSGGVITCKANILAGDVMHIVVGQKGRNSNRQGTSNTGPGGTGGTHVAIYRSGAWYHLISAGGGGSTGGNGATPGPDAVLDSVITTDRGWAMAVGSETQTDYHLDGGSGGAGYRGGGGGGGGEYGSAGGSGFYGNGGDAAWNGYHPSVYGGVGGDANHSSTAHGSHAVGGTRVNNSGGDSFFFGAYGGGYTSPQAYSSKYPCEGGFGGGGAGGTGNNPGGGSGGYSGGGGLGQNNGAAHKQGRCGTSYVTPANATQIGSHSLYAGSVGTVILQSA